MKKRLRSVYLAYVMVVACAHLLIGLSPSVTAATAGTGSNAWLMLLFAAWLLAAVWDLAMTLFGVVPLTFGWEAVVGLLSLTILLIAGGGMFYLVVALVAPVLVWLKAGEELAGRDHHFRPSGVH